MKKLFAILLVIVLTSCGGSSSSVPPEATEQSAALEPPKSNTDYKNIIGKPIKIGNLEIAQYDFPRGRMNWEDAKKSCEALGDGWRLPTYKELNILYQNKVAIGGFESTNYWSSEEYDGTKTEVWTKSFVNGQEPNHFKKYKNSVRAVRSF